MKFKRKLIMKIFKLFTIVLFIIFSSLTSITYAESLKFDASTYEGEVKKGKAHGVGIFTFSDGSTYEGKVKSNPSFDFILVKTAVSIIIVNKNDVIEINGFSE